MSISIHIQNQHASKKASRHENVLILFDLTIYLFITSTSYLEENTK